MSVDNSCSCSSSNQDVAGHVAPVRPRLLEGIGSFAVSLTFLVLRKSRHLPLLVGPMIGAVEDIVGPCIQPLATRVGSEGIYLLSLADDKLYALGGIAKEKVPFVSGFVSNAKRIHNIFGQVTTVASGAYDQVCDRGIIGAAADTWVKYEVTVKSKSEDSLQFVNTVPVLRAFVPVICTVGAPIASAIASWLAKHSKLKRLHLVLHEDDEQDLKGVLEEKHVFVVDNRAADISIMDPGESSPGIDLGNRSWIPESSECSAHVEPVRKKVSFEEIGKEERVQAETTGKGKADIVIAHPISSADDDSDDELTVLFDSGWHLGTISPSKRILSESKASKKGWW